MLFDWIVIGIIALIGFAFWWVYWPRSPRAEFHDRWSDECDRRGLNAQERIDEYQFRHALTRLRRRASDSVLASAGSYEFKIAEIAADEATTLAAYRPQVAKKFLSVVNGARLSDILYPDAMAAVLAMPSPAAGYIPTEDDVAALTTIRG